MKEIADQLKILNQQLELMNEKLELHNLIQGNIEKQLDNIYFCFADNPKF